jgi:hypothetical protein
LSALSAVLLLTLGAARPLPDPRDEREGELATQCIQLYRLQPTQVPLDAAGCEDAGYGLEFMRERGDELRALEQRHADEREHARAEAAARAEARAHRGELEAPCRALAFDAGPGPDGGAALCARAGLSPGVFAAQLAREQSLQRLADQQDESRQRRTGLLALGASVVVAALALRWRARRG